MRIEYKNPNIIDRLDEAIEQAKKEGKRISNFRLSASELMDFCNTTGMAYSKQAHYTYKHYTIAYDWSGIK
jgi:phosphoribulokinase